MTQTDTEGTPAREKGKGKAFFDRADEVAETGSWDFAIELYIEGLRREPDNIERGLNPLREVALKRKLQGGKGPGLREQLKHRATKDPVESLANAAYLLAKEPGSRQYMEQMVQAAIKLEDPHVARWSCDLLLEEQRQAKKPNKRVVLLLKEAFANINEYGKAIQACEMGLQLSPNDSKLQEDLQDLSAKYTIKKGRYDEEGGFEKSVADMEKQKELAKQDAMVKDKDFLAKEVDRTRAEYLQSPAVAGKINAFVDALLRTNDETYENEAIDVLTKAHRDTGAYQFKMRIGDVRMRQMTRRYRRLVEQGEKEAAAEQARKQLVFELEEFAERAINYPTDLGIKYELGRRQFLAGKLDEAIASFQQARRNPRQQVSALNYLGQTFARKGWYHEAADTFAKALELEMPEERIKEIRYSYGDALEHMGEHKSAEEQFSEVAQLDYNYKDVRQRLEALRKKVGD
jgi:tetratricopeptide (TPR) repeat protein